MVEVKPEEIRKLLPNMVGYLIKRFKARPEDAEDATMMAAKQILEKGYDPNKSSLKNFAFLISKRRLIDMWKQESNSANFQYIDGYDGIDEAFYCVVPQSEISDAELKSLIRSAMESAFEDAGDDDEDYVTFWTNVFGDKYVTLDLQTNIRELFERHRNQMPEEMPKSEDTFRRHFGKNEEKLLNYLRKHYPL